MTAPSDYTRTVRRPDPRLPESWCREGVAHNHGACGDLWDSTSRSDTLEAARWADEQREPWRLDPPEIPDSVMAFKDGNGLTWVRSEADPRRWSRWSGDDAVRYRNAPITYVVMQGGLPLVECDDPRGVSLRAATAGSSVVPSEGRGR